ncbi:hypothetical protein [Acetobacter oeni]|uniref:hypothetical protein n=1 Tax=Acetobacter oeni TaxID=304077 RepID=UPI0011BE393A|nr:hypothetical protein [Acetobacter oeni]MBB3883141.1 hypothetical protein [Acetobacter oeni]NHO19219.1 hypothetical protein [Acetobacter oeni]
MEKGRSEDFGLAVRTGTRVRLCGLSDSRLDGVFVFGNGEPEDQVTGDVTVQPTGLRVARGR